MSAIARGAVAIRVALVLAMAACSVAAVAGGTLRLGWSAPGADPLPAGWKALTFRNISRHTQYRIVGEDGGYVVRAQAESSASGLIHPLDLDPREQRVLRWRWKVSKLIEKADIRSRQGDDYPARIYVAFAYDPARAGLGQRMRYEAARLVYGEYPPHAGLNYVWDGKAPVGTIVPNTHTERVRMIVVESGATRLQQWVDYERDIYADYHNAFGEEPTRISGVAIMTDSDGTGESVVTWYGDISLSGAAQ